MSLWHIFISSSPMSSTEWCSSSTGCSPPLLHLSPQLLLHSSHHRLLLLTLWRVFSQHLFHSWGGCTLKIKLFTESEQKPPREGETTQRGPSHLSWGSPPGSDLPVDWEGQSTPTIQSPQMKFRFNGHLLFLIVSEMSPRIAACGLLLAHLSIALVLFCNHLDIFIYVYGIIIIIPYTYFLLHKIFDLYLKQEMWQLKGDTQYAWDPCGLQYGEVEKTMAIIMLSTMMTNCQKRRRWQWLSTKETITMIVDKGSDDNDKIKLTARSDLLPHSRCLLVRIWAKICFISSPRPKCLSGVIYLIIFLDPVKNL